MNKKCFKVILPFVISLPFFVVVRFVFGVSVVNVNISILVFIGINVLGALLYWITKKRVTYFIPLGISILASIGVIVYIFATIETRMDWGAGVAVVLAIQLIGISIFSIGIFNIFEFVQTTKIIGRNIEPAIFKRKDLILIFLFLYTIFTYLKWINLFILVSYSGTTWILLIFTFVLSLIFIVVNRFISIREYKLSYVIYGVMIFSLFRYHLSRQLITDRYSIVIDMIYFSFVIILMADLLIKIITDHKKA